jgi:hypothetical protein
MGECVDQGQGGTRGCNCNLIHHIYQSCHCKYRPVGEWLMIWFYCSSSSTASVTLINLCSFQLRCWDDSDEVFFIGDVCMLPCACVCIFPLILNCVN